MSSSARKPLLPASSAYPRAWRRLLRGGQRWLADAQRYAAKRRQAPPPPVIGAWPDTLANTARQLAAGSRSFVSDMSTRPHPVAHARPTEATQAMDASTLTLARGAMTSSTHLRWLCVALLASLLWRLLRRTRRAPDPLAERAAAVEDVYERARRDVAARNHASALYLPSHLTPRVELPDIASTLHLRAGAWRIARPLPVPMCGAYAVVRHSHLFAFSAGNPVYAAAIGPDGQLGPWQATGDDMPRTTAGASWIAGEDRVYLATAAANREGTPVFSARFLDGGRLGDWRLECGIPVGLSHAALALCDDMLVLAGGRDRRGTSARVYSAPLAAEGRLEAWRGAPSLPMPLVGHAMAAVDGSLWIVGGRCTDGRAQTSVYRAQLAGGKLSPWQSTTPLPSSRAQSAVLAQGRALFILGGDNRGPHDDILRADSPTDGQVWRPIHARLPHALTAPAVAVSDRILYLLGGWDKEHRTSAATGVLTLDWTG